MLFRWGTTPWSTQGIVTRWIQWHQAGVRSLQKSNGTGSHATGDGWHLLRFGPGTYHWTHPLLPHPLELDLLLCRPSGFLPTLFLSSGVNKDFTGPQPPQSLFVLPSVQCGPCLFPGKASSLIIFTFQQLLFLLLSLRFIKMLMVDLLRATLYCKHFLLGTCESRWLEAMLLFLTV